MIRSAVQTMSRQCEYTASALIFYTFIFKPQNAESVKHTVY